MCEGATSISHSGFDGFVFCRAPIAAGCFANAPFDFSGDFTSSDGGGLTVTGTTPTPMAYGRHRPATFCKKISKVIRGDCQILRSLEDSPAA